MTYVGRCPTPHKLLKKLDQNFYCIGMLRLHVILGRKTAKRLSVSAKPRHRQRKLAFFSVLWLLARLRPSQTASK